MAYFFSLSVSTSFCGPGTLLMDIYTPFALPAIVTVMGIVSRECVDIYTRSTWLPMGTKDPTLVGTLRAAVTDTVIATSGARSEGCLR